MRPLRAAGAAADRHSLTVSEFRGVDLVSAPGNVDPRRSPEAPNMIRDVPGKVRKRMGFRLLQQYPARINGIFRFTKAGADTETLVHAGTGLYRGGTLLCGGLADARSCAFQLGGRLWLADGAALRYYDGAAVGPAAALAYVPKLVIGRAPAGGGTAFEDLNLLGDRWTEDFRADGSAAVYQLSYDGLADGCTVQRLTAPETWTTLAPGSDYTFDPAAGTVTFAVPPPLSPVEGADSVRITAGKAHPEWRARIDGCTLGVLYGVGGAADRLFLSGNPAWPARDWHSGLDDPAYFPLGGWADLGQSSPVAGYAIVDNKLAALKAGDPDGRNIVLREGRLTADDKPSFPVVGALQGPGAAGPAAVACLRTEPVYFAGDGGVYAVTPADANAERYAQCRSYYLGPALSALPDKAGCCAAVFGDFYLLAAGARLFVLDSLLKTYEPGAPYSTHQYEGYVLEGIGARVLDAAGGALRFGRADGALLEFYSDPGDPASYSDCGAAIAARWDTPSLSMPDFTRGKRFSRLGLRLSAAPATGVTVSAQLDGVWRELFREAARLRYWSFAGLCFSKLTFSCDATARACGRRLRLPRTDKLRLRFANDAAGEPFGLSDLKLEFTQTGRVR